MQATTTSSDYVFFRMVTNYGYTTLTDVQSKLMSHCTENLPLEEQARLLDVCSKLREIQENIAINIATK